MDHDNPPDGVELLANELTENLIETEVITSAEHADAVFASYYDELARMAKVK